MSVWVQIVSFDNSQMNVIKHIFVLIICKSKNDQQKHKFKE